MATFLAEPAIIAEALARHRHDVDALRHRCARELSICRGADALASAGPPDVPLDDLFLLRFVLSHGTAAAALPALRDALLWRAANARALLAVRRGAPPPHSALIQSFSMQGSHGPAADGSPLFIVRAGLANLSPMMSLVSLEMAAEWMLFAREPDFMQCDRASRDTGKLVKLVSLVDWSHGSVSGLLNAQFFRAVGASSKASEKYYPQLLGTIVLTNLPPLFSALTTLVRPLLSLRTLSKLKICPGAGKSKAPLSACPVATRAWGAAGLPTFLGGQCTCADRGKQGCIQDRSNDATQPAAPKAPLDLSSIAAEHAAALAHLAWQTVLVPAGSSVTLPAGVLPPGGGAVEFACALVSPSQSTSPVTLSVLVGPAGSRKRSLFERRVRVCDGAAAWADADDAAEIEVRVDNPDGKRAKEVRVGWGVVGTGEMEAADPERGGEEP